MRLPVEDGRSGRVGYPVPPGPSILEQMWGRLVEETESLLAADDWMAGQHEADAVRAKLKTKKIGICYGMAQMVAILLNPYNPNVDEVRAEVMRRIEERTAV